MPTDPLYEALHPFHQWAQIAAVCAFILAAASCAVLAISQRLSRRWWMGIGVFVLSLLAVAFGARSRGASYDLYAIALCFVRPVSGCEVWTQDLTNAEQRVSTLGIALLVVTALGVGATVATLLRWRLTASERRRPHSRVVLLPLAIFISGYGVFQTANSVARWTETAYLADITRAGDGLGQIPLLEAIAGTMFGAVLLAIGLALVIFFSESRRTVSTIAAVMPEQAHNS